MTEYVPNECCLDPVNRREGPGPRGLEGLGSPPPEVAITHCRVCECRHVAATLNSGELGLVGKEM